MTTLDDWASASCGVLYFTLFFFWHVRIRDVLSNKLTSLTPLPKRLPWRTAQLIVRIPLYGVPGYLGYTILSLLRPDLSPPIIITSKAVWGGLLLGGGMLMTGSALANAVFMTVWRLTGQQGGYRQAKSRLRAEKDSGWIRSYTLAYNNLSFVSFLSLAGLSVIGEELAFRGTLLPLFAPRIWERARNCVVVHSFRRDSKTIHAVLARGSSSDVGGSGCRDRSRMRWAERR